MFKGGMANMMEQAQKMREEMERMQKEVALRTVETSSGGGMVKIVMNGKQQVVSVTIDPEVIKMNDIEMLQDLVRAGMNQAVKASQDMAAQEMGKMTGGLGALANMFKGPQ